MQQQVPVQEILPGSLVEIPANVGDAYRYVDSFGGVARIDKRTALTALVERRYDGGGEYFLDGLSDNFVPLRLRFRGPSHLGLRPIEEAAAFQQVKIEKAKADLQPFGALLPFVLLGSDPEVFVEDNEGNLLPAFTFLPAKDERPKSLGVSRAFWDGFQVEFDLPDGIGCLQSFTAFVREEMQHLLQLARAKAPNARLSLASVVEIPEDVLLASKPEHVALGCSPSLNIYGNKGKFCPDGRMLPYRFAGYHHHIGLNGWQPTPGNIEGAIKTMDALYGVALVSLAAKFDDPIRRKYYGLAGEYRLPKHGLEYRVPSNILLCHPAIHHLCWNLARAAAQLGLLGLRAIVPLSDTEVQHIINNSDVTAAREFLKVNAALYEKVFMAACRYDRLSTSWAINTFQNGLETVIQKPHDIDRNWGLSEAREWEGARQWSYLVTRLEADKRDVV